jgi:DedD protein
VDAVDLVRKPGEVPGLQAPPEGSIRQGDYYINGNAQGSKDGTIITVVRPSSAAVPDTPPSSRASSPAKPAPAASKPPVPPAAPRPAQAKPAVQTKTYNDYWVQTGAFSTVAKAEGVKESLAAKGITSIIENRDVDGKTFFRVRVGPYTSPNEANYWLSLIKTINGFEDSQVRQTQSRR